jgi:hypothetical protein
MKMKMSMVVSLWLTLTGTCLVIGLVGCDTKPVETRVEPIQDAPPAGLPAEYPDTPPSEPRPG